MWIEHIKEKAKESGFNVTFLTELNVFSLISSPILSKLELTRSTRFRLDPTLRKQLLMMAVMIDHGGVAIAQHMLLFDNLTWITQVYKEPFLWNKFGKRPEVVMPFNPRFGGPFAWSYDSEYATKRSDSLAFDVRFMAALPRSPLLKTLLDEVLTNLRHPSYGELDY